MNHFYVARGNDLAVDFAYNLTKYTLVEKFYFGSLETLSNLLFETDYCYLSVFNDTIGIQKVITNMKPVSDCVIMRFYTTGTNKQKWYKRSVSFLKVFKLKYWWKCYLTVAFIIFIVMPLIIWGNVIFVKIVYRWININPTKKCNSEHPTETDHSCVL